MVRIIRDVGPYYPLYVGGNKSMALDGLCGVGRRDDLRSDKGGEIVADITPIEANMPHKVSEVVCLRCLTRWISVRPIGTLLKALECPKCGALGVVIETGEDMEAR